MVNFKQIFSIAAALSLVQSAVYFHTKFGHSYDAYLTTTLQNQGELLAVADDELIITAITATTTKFNNNTSSSNATVTGETEMIGTILDHANADGGESSSSSTTATTTSSTRIRPDFTAATVVATTAEAAVAEIATIATVTTKQPSTTTTTVTTTSAAQTQNELRFYRHVTSEMKRLINTTTLMDWNRHRRRRGKFSQFLDFFESYHIHDDKLDLTTVPDLHSYDFFYHGGGLCTPAKVFGRYRESSNSTTKKSLPHVLLSRLNPDFGALSSNIMGKTAKLRNLRQDWKKQKCTPQTILDYINHPDTLGVITNQFQMWNHPKVTSIPLGLSAGNHDLLLQAIHRNDTDSNSKRPKLLMINANVKERPGWRSEMIHHVVVNFWRRSVPLQNTYNAYTPATCDVNTTAAATGPRAARQCYYQEMLRSTFIMSPGGLGLDCFRHWEALYLGCIPVLERNHRADTDGWIGRTMADLPIAWIDSYADLTPSWLRAEYERLVSNATRPFEEIYNYEKLTRQYWIQYAHSIVREYKEKRKQQQQPPPPQQKKKKTARDVQ